FQSLRELRHPLQNEKDLQYHIHWVNCCLILHNMIIRFEEGGEQSLAWAIGENPDGGRDEDADADGPIGDQTEYGSAGQRFRRLMMQRLFE
ncbi:hypothetical protein PAXRUDRAFT_39586, partial [Paxillus rubicundulus Ve08.2h10]